MKVTVALTFTSILLISGCDNTSQESIDGQTAESSESTALTLNFRCESGETISATYPSIDTATVQYKGATYDMEVAVSASGARYVGGGLEWWTKGSGVGATGTLFRHLDDGTSGETVESCVEY